MNNRIFIFLTTFVAIAMLAMLASNLTLFIAPRTQEKYIAYNDVKGIAIEHHGFLYTLNFEQQNRVIGWINMSLAINTTPPAQNSLTEPDVSNLIIYRFNKTDLILKPIGYSKNNLVFLSSELNSRGYMQDVSLGDWKSLLTKTYDP